MKATTSAQITVPVHIIIPTAAPTGAFFANSLEPVISVPGRFTFQKKVLGHVRDHKTFLSGVYR